MVVGLTRFPMGPIAGVLAMLACDFPDGGLDGRVRLATFGGKRDPANRAVNTRRFYNWNGAEGNGNYFWDGSYDFTVNSRCLYRSYRLGSRAMPDYFIPLTPAMR